MNKFFVTTPIYYVNDIPHVGSSYTTLAADIIARYYRLKIGEKNVFFLTGTDEHGQKIADTAKIHNKTPKEFVNSMTPVFKNAWKQLNINYDYFIRTTDPRHEKIVSNILRKLYDSGYIYSGVYEGLYCIGCEKFYKESELVNGKCVLHPNKDIVFQREKNYFFRLKELVEKKVLPKIINGDYKILPEEREIEILSRIKQGVEDISISRENVPWGIKIPWDKSQTVYVWIEALINYYSATKFLKNKQKFWPADLHLMAKDILWFHAVIWEAILIAAKIDLPKVVYAHGFFTVNGQKMSKSLGNTITPKQMVDKYTTDGARYLLISSVSFGSDGDISFASFDKKYNGDLANGLGNLVSRVAKMAEKSKFEFEIKDERKFFPELEKAIKKYQFSDSLKIIWEEITKLDQEINKTEPWKLSGGNLKRNLEIYLKKILQIAYNLKPFMPDVSENIYRIISTKPISELLFPRI